jgi:large subunit ribosomal protein L19
MNKLEAFNKSQIKTGLIDIRPGDTVRVHEKPKAGEKRKGESFEGLVLSKKHGSGTSAMITVRRVSLGVGVERIFPIHSPNIEKIEIVKRSKARRAKLNYLKTAKGRKARLKREEYKAVVAPEEVHAAEVKTEETAK